MDKSVDLKESEIIEDSTQKTSDIKRKKLSPPEECRGLKKIDEKLFSKAINVPCIITDVGNIGKLSKCYRKYLIRLKNFKPIQTFFDEDGNEDNTKKIVMMDPDFISSFDSFSEEEKEEMKKHGITAEDFGFRIVNIDYKNWFLDDLIGAVLPDGLRFSGFSVVGHVAQLNLREELLEYKYALAQILIDKVEYVKTVINKIDSINDEYRHFKMELLGGENNMEVVLKENSCLFEFNFEKVYWNSRLGTEHARLIKKLQPCDVLYDVCCGVGPFAILAAKKQCTVLANDLNPVAVSYLKKNIKHNKVEKYVKSFNFDGNQFIKTEMKNHMLSFPSGKESKTFKTHIVINLPQTSHTFLKSFVGLFTVDEFNSLGFDIILHVYVFVKGNDKEECDVKHDAVLLVKENLSVAKLDNEIMEVFNVRHVAPNKDMIRVSLKMDDRILVERGTKRKHEDTLSSKTHEHS